MNYTGMTKNQIASAAGVSAKTFRRWITQRDYQHMKDCWGIDKNTKVLPPAAVKYLCDRFCITL